MKIAILHSSDLQNVSPGGITQYVQKIILSDIVDEITLYGTCDVNNKFYKIGEKYEEELNGKKYFFIPICNNKKRPISIFYFIKLLTYLKELKKYDLIFAQRMEYALPFIRKGYNLVLAIHGSGKYAYLFWGKTIGIIYNFIEKLAIRNSKKVIVLLNREEFGIPYYRKKYSKYKEKFVYGKVPIDIKIFKKKNKLQTKQKLGFDENSKIILYFGRIENNPKRVLLFPKIIEKVKIKLNNIKFIVIGDGSDKLILEKEVKRLNLDNNFIFFNNLKHGDKLVEYINCADLSVILSSFEGICMSALESLACGVPVISTDVGDIKEYINNNQNGVVIPNDKEDIIIKNISDILIDYYTANREIIINNKYQEYSISVWKQELKSILTDTMKREGGE